MSGIILLRSFINKCKFYGLLIDQIMNDKDILCIFFSLNYICSWNYKCIDIYTEVQKGKIGTVFKVFQIEVRRDTSEDFLYVDEVYIGKNPTNVEEGTRKTQDCSSIMC